MPTGADMIRILNLERLDDDVFLGHQPFSSTLDKVYGGQLFGQALAAARQTVDPVRAAHSVQAFCLDPGNHDAPIHYRVERLRDGRSFSARSVVAVQDGRPLLRVMTSFQVPEPGLGHAEKMPAVPSPADLPTIEDVIRDHSALPDVPWRHEWAGLDVRYVVRDLAGGGMDDGGRQQIWMRVCDRLPDDPTLHREVLTYLSDICLLSAGLVPHGILLGAPELPRATLNHSVWLHAAARPDEWLFVDQRSPHATGAGR